MYDNSDYVNSGIQWIGDIPREWKIKPLKHILDTKYKGVQPEYVEEKSGIKVVNQASFSRGFFNHEKQNYSRPVRGMKFCKQGDVLLATTGGGVSGKAYYFNEEGTFFPSADVQVLRFNNNVTSKYIFYILDGLYDYLESVLSRGSTNQKHLMMPMLANMKFPEPSFNEQREIVCYLDEQSTSIDCTIKNLNTIIEDMEQYKRALVYEVVTGKKEI